MKRRVLVTGGTGFVGSHAVEAFSAAGWQVRVLVRNPGVRPWGSWCQAEVCLGHVERAEELRLAVQGCDAVVHCAAVTKATRVEEYYRINGDAIVWLTDAARDAGVKRFVLCSTHAAIGPAQDGVSSKEDDSPRPLTHYGRSKLAGEQRLRESAGGMEWVILRPPSIMGPRDEQFIPLYKGAARYGIYPRFGPGRQVYSYLYVKDFVRALIVAAQAVSGINETYFVAHPQVLDWESAASTIAGLAGKRARAVAIPSVLIRAVGRMNDVYARLSSRPALLSSEKVREILAGPWVCSTEKISRAWGFKCEYSTEQALRETLAFYRETKRI